MWTPVATVKQYHKFAEKKQGDVIVEGFFIGTTDGTYGRQHNFKTQEGVHHVLNSSGHLNYCIEQISVGDYCRVTYNGETTLTKGPMSGKKSHQFLIDVNKEIKMGVDPTPTPIEEPKPSEDDPLF